jgi:glycosyltransferase involved in cell wall biosynthesis
MKAKEWTAVLLSHEYPPYIFGGVATYTKQLAEWLSNNGWRVFVIAGKVSVIEKIKIEKHSDKLIIVRVYFPEIPPRWLFYAFPARNILRRLLESKIDTILSNNPLTWITLNNLQTRAKIATFFHGSIYALLAFFHYITSKDIRKISPEELIYYNEISLINLLTKKDLSISNIPIFVAKHVKMEFENIYKDVIGNKKKHEVVIYPGIDYDNLVKLRMNLEKTEKSKVVIAYVGRLYYTKGITHSVKVAEFLAGEGYGKEVELWIFGNGPLEGWLKKYSCKKKIDHIVKYYGFVERSRLLTLLAKHVDVLLHPSLYEGAPISVMEAQALGIPVVTYDLPWVREFVFNGVNGYTARYPDIARLSENIFNALKLNSNNIITYAKKYDREMSFSTLENLIIETLA